MLVYRVKRYHSKSRSGCLTCRRRRIKCDEGKPICDKCLRANQECGYGNFAAYRPVDKSYATLVESDYDSTGEQLGEQADEQHNEQRDEQVDDTVATYGSYDVSDVIVTSDDCASINQYMSYESRTLEEQRSVQFWLEISAPNMETYGPMRGLFTILFPQWAHRSAMVKHFLVATALNHENLLLPSFERPTTLAYRPFYHVQLGLQSLIREQHSKLSRVLGSMIAWMFEMMVGNFPAAKVHVAASIKLMDELEAETSPSNEWSSFESLHYQIKPGLRLMKSYSDAAFDEENKQINYQESGSQAYSKIQFLSLDDARSTLSQRIEYYCSQDLKTNQITREFRCFVTAWHLALREYRRTHPETNQQHKATLFLFSVAMALLPENEVGDYSYSTNPAIVCHILTNVNGSLDQVSHDTSVHVKAHVETTLKVVLELILENFHDESIQQRATELLSRIMVNESSLTDDMSSMVALNDASHN